MERDYAHSKMCDIEPLAYSILLDALVDARDDVRLKDVWCTDSGLFKDVVYTFRHPKIIAKLYVMMEETTRIRTKELADAAKPWFTTYKLDNVAHKSVFNPFELYTLEPYYRRPFWWDEETGMPRFLLHPAKALRRKMIKEEQKKKEEEEKKKAAEAEFEEAS